MGQAPLEVQHVGDGVYLATAPARVDAAYVDAVLNHVWSQPGWAQPWGLVIDIKAAESYDPDVRKTRVPSKDLRAVGTAIVCTKSMHKMVIRSVGLGLRTMMGFDLSAHDEIDDAVEQMKRSVAACKAEGRSY